MLMLDNVIIVIAIAMEHNQLKKLERDGVEGPKVEGSSSTKTTKTKLRWIINKRY